MRCLALRCCLSYQVYLAWSSKWHCIGCSNQFELEEGKEAEFALLDPCVSRVRPVMMAAITTMLGMIPLISDAFLGSMAITIIFGLGFASLLTLVVLPVMYSLMFKINVTR
jgi:multidrug efflux pump subunit AcrB